MKFNIMIRTKMTICWKNQKNSDFIKFQTCDFKSSFDSINNDDENWLKTFICEKNVFYEKTSSNEKMKSIVNLISLSLFFNATAISRSLRIFIQLKIFNDISFMIFDLSENRYIKNEKKKKSIFSFLFSNSKFSFIFHLIVSSIELINLIDLISNKNVIQRQKEKKNFRN